MVKYTKRNDNKLSALVVFVTKVKKQLVLRFRGTQLIMRFKIETIILWLLTLLCLFLVLKTSNEPVIDIPKDSKFSPIFQNFKSGNSIIFNLSIGYIVSIIFYVLIVWLPENRRKRVIKNNLKIQYQYFKEDTINILLSICPDSSFEGDLSSELMDMVAFRRFFNERVTHNQTRWHVVKNGLNDFRLRELQLIIEIFKDEVGFVLNNVAIEDKAIFSFFKNLRHLAYKLKNTTDEPDDIKSLMDFISQVFTGWSVIDGCCRENDIIEVMIKKI